MSKTWLVNVYLAGDNNLTEAMVGAIRGMRSAATGDVRVMAQFDPLGAMPRVYTFPDTSSDPLGITGKLLKDWLNEHPDVYSQLLVKLGVSAAELDEILEDGTAKWSSLWGTNLSVERRWRRRMPARTPDPGADPEEIETDYRMLILSGHGNGAVGEFLKDLNPYSSLNTISLSKVIEDSSKFIDIIGMDSCLMSMAEVCCQLAKTKKVGILVGSEGLLVNTGWPYQKLLEGIVQLPDRIPEIVATEIVQQYIRCYEDYAFAGISTDCSAVRLSAWNEETQDFDPEVNGFNEIFVNPFKTLTGRLRAKCEASEPFRNAVLLAHWVAQCYNDDQYVDIWDFCNELEKYYQKAFTLEEGDEIIESLAAVKVAVESVVLLSRYSGAAFQYSHGLSVYFPWALDDYKSEYELLAFPQDTDWHLFLKEFLEATRRKPRDGEPPPQKCAPMDMGMLIIRKSPPGTKGGSSCTKAGGTKNHPHECLRSNGSDQDWSGESG